MRIKSVENGQPMAAPDGIADNAWVYCRAGARPLDLIRVGDRNEAYFRLADAPNLFLSYTAVTGAVKLFSSPQDASFRLQDVGEGYSIQNLTWKQYMWLSGESPYVTRSGNPSNRNARWWIEGLP